MHLTVEQQTLILHGDIHFNNAQSIYEASLPYFERHHCNAIDWSQVTHSNSAGIALLVAWKQYAKTHHRTIQLIAIPASLRAIMQVAHCESLI